MTTYAADPSEADAGRQLESRLSQVAMHRARNQRWGWLLGMLWACAGLFLLTILVDAMWHLPAAGRLALACTIVAMAVLALLGLMTIRRQVSSPMLLNDALRVESHHDLRDSALANGLCLSRENVMGLDQDSSLKAQLRRRAIERAAQVARGADVRRAADGSSVRRHGVILLLVLAIAGVLLGAMPRLYSAGIARLVDPWGDHPPFSLTRFAIETPIEAVVEGEDVRVRIRLAGQLPASLAWVELDTQGQEQARWPVERTGEATYERRLVQVRDDIRFRLAASTGMTRAMHIRVVARPADPQAASTETPVEEETPVSQPATMPASQPASSESQAGHHPALVAAGQCQNELIEAASAANAAAQRLSQSGGQDEELTDQAQAAAEHFNQLVKTTQATLQDMLQRQGDQQLPDDARQAISQFSDLLKQMEIPRQPALPEDRDIPAVNQWADRLGQAAQADLKKLMENRKHLPAGPSVGQSDDESGYTTEGGAEQPGELDHGQARQGVIRERTQGSQGQADTSDARGSQVPPAYRDKVQHYFDRINQDQAAP